MKENYSTVWEELYVSAKQYICALAVYLMKKSLILKISIYLEIGAPRHGKDVLYGILKRDKYTREKK